MIFTTAFDRGKNVAAMLALVETSAGQHDQEAKDMLMRVGFEPTPFRTSDCSEPGGVTLS